MVQSAQPFVHPSIRQARKVAWLLDDAIEIPVLKQRVGLDPILGLIPGGGDTVMFIFSLYILWIAYDLNLPRRVMVKMLANIAIDWLLGMVPVAGDLLDFAWKANTANVRLLEEAYLEADRHPYQPQVVNVTVEG